MKTPAPQHLLLRYLKERRLRQSRQRDSLLECFLSTEKHVSAEEFHLLAARKHPGVGLATAHRALKLFVRCGLAREVSLGDRSVRYEHAYQHAHHDHLICSVCGRVVEFCDPVIEERQHAIARRHGFDIEHHVMEIFGKCRGCRGRLKDGLSSEAMPSSSRPLPYRGHGRRRCLRRRGRKG